MIQYNNKVVEVGHFPDGALLLKEDVEELVREGKGVTITWLYESNEELVTLCFLTKHLQNKGVNKIQLRLPYIPNARQDRVKTQEDVFTLKYFAEIINDLSFSKVTVLDPHSYVSEGLIDRIQVESPKEYVDKVIKKLEEEEARKILLFYPDEGARKRYATMFSRPYAFGMKERDWETGCIKGLQVSAQRELIQNQVVLIIDDICSRGGTFYYSAKALKELGAKEVYLYVSHCENTILDGDILEGNMIKKVFTTNSIFTKNHKNLEVFEYE